MEKLQPLSVFSRRFGKTGNHNLLKKVMSDLKEKIYAAVRLIPRGKVASYSQVAALVGNCNLRRYVGNALHENPSNQITPCHRVVNAKGFCSGSFSFGGPDAQREKLEAEGITFVDEFFKFSP